MRIRVVKPDYWRDRLLASFRPEVREFYIGLWMQADDAGWLRWLPEEVAADLYPYRGVRTRERQVVEWMGQLADAKRVVLHPCGHAVIPTFTQHQRTTGGVKVTRTRDAHLRCSEVGFRSDTDESVGILQEGKVKERKGKEGKEVPSGTNLKLIDGEWQVAK